MQQVISRDALNSNSQTTHMDSPTPCSNDEEKNPSKFNYSKTVILRAFNRKWYPKQARISTWQHSARQSGMPYLKQRKRSTNCHSAQNVEITATYLLRKSFPRNPKFSLPIAATVTLSADSHEQEEKTITKSIVLDLEKSFSDRFGHSLLDSVIDNCKETVEQRRTQSDIKRERRSLL